MTALLTPSESCAGDSQNETGREPGPDDPCAFDPDSDDPQPEAEAKIKSVMGDIAERAGLVPDLTFAIRKTGLLVTQRNQDALDEDLVGVHFFEHTPTIRS